MPRIALVDDDRNVLTSVSIALEAEGYRVATYTGGDTALDGFRAVQPDLAILDIKMPRMDGMEMAMENNREIFIRIQNTIETIERAIWHEKFIESKKPGPFVSPVGLGPAGPGAI